MKRKYYIGVDLGGSKVSVGLVHCNGSVVRYKRKKFNNKNDREILLIIESCINSLMTKKVKSIGIGIPAIATTVSDKFTSEYSPNLELLERMDIKEYFKKKKFKSVYLENDANCFIIGEHKYGSAKGYSDCVGLTLGSGIGCGIIIGNKIRHGAYNQCGEILDITTCDGILEDTLSARFISRNAGTSNAEEAAYLAQKGNKKAILSWKEYGKKLGWLISIIKRVIDPEIFILGGSISNSYNLFKNEMLKTANNKTPKVISKLKEKAAIIGAAFLKK